MAPACAQGPVPEFHHCLECEENGPMANQNPVAVSEWIRPKFPLLSGV